jgi:hypothetical protein
MADQWLFKSETYDNCNCAINCGCQFNLPSTHGYCPSAFVGNIVEGHFNDTPLAGLIRERSRLTAWLDSDSPNG